MATALAACTTQGTAIEPEPSKGTRSFSKSADSMADEVYITDNSSKRDGSTTPACTSNP